MSASQRVSRGFYRCICCLAALCVIQAFVGAFAQEPDCQNLGKKLYAKMEAVTRADVEKNTAP